MTPYEPKRSTLASGYWQGKVLGSVEIDIDDEDQCHSEADAIMMARIKFVECMLEWEADGECVE